MAPLVCRQPAADRPRPDPPPAGPPPAGSSARQYGHRRMTMSAAPADLRQAHPGSATRPQSEAGSRQHRVRPAPRREPPFDDELTERLLSLVGPLDQPLPLDGLGLAAAPVPQPTAPDSGTVRPTGCHELPEPAPMARRL